jgi:two-component system sensor histidine kinase KdpD
MDRAIIRGVRGAAVALVGVAVLTGAMYPWRSQLSIATPGLVLVIPVVVGVVAGGFVAGALSVLAGFLAFDIFFVPPYLTLTVGAAQNWLALGVYVAVMLLVARVVARMDAARADARRRSNEIRELFGLSDLLVADKSLDELLSAIATTLADLFGARQVAVLLPQAGRLEIVASAGEPLTGEQLHRVLPAPGELATFDARPFEHDGLLVLALASAGRPIGLIALSAETAARHEREPLLIFANHIAVAVERAQLREEAVNRRLTEGMARLAKTLVTAVSHDLRTPLASIKASSSTLADAGFDIGPEATQRLAQVIDSQADRLADLVQNLLDMSRIQAGVLKPRWTVSPLCDLVEVVLSDLAPALRGRVVDVDIPDDLPPVAVDPMLISRVLANLLENAIRHGPKNTKITVRALLGVNYTVEVSVTDQGPGVSPQRRTEIFELNPRRDGDAGAGLGLTIAKTFVEAHEQRIWVDDAPEGGARFCFSLSSVAPISREPTVAAHPHR